RPNGTAPPASAPDTQSPWAPAEAPPSPLNPERFFLPSWSAESRVSPDFTAATRAARLGQLRLQDEGSTYLRGAVVPLKCTNIIKPWLEDFDVQQIL
ncbi:unnamed protein product, partial [Gulo gulo]